MAEVIRTPAAEEDLIDIWATIALDSRKAADSLHQELTRRMEQLAAFPESGRLRSEIADDVRSLSCRSYLILYRFDNDAVEIVRVVHGARDLTALF